MTEEGKNANFNATETRMAKKKKKDKKKPARFNGNTLTQEDASQPAADPDGASEASSPRWR